jgi:hypothetical protein
MKPQENKLGFFHIKIWVSFVFNALKTSGRNIDKLQH